MTNSKQATFRFVILAGILIFLNIIGYFFYGYFDLTEDKRFTLTEPTKTLTKAVEDKVFIEVYLAGDNIPANYRRLQAATTALLDQLRGLNRNIDYQFINPNEGTTEQINQMREKLKALGIMPKMTMDNAELSAKAIYPFAAMRMGDRVTSVSLLQNDAPSAMPEEIMLNNSINLLEYGFANGLKSLKTREKPSLLFIEGHGELIPFERADLEQTLKLYYTVQASTLDSVISIDRDRIDLAIIAKPHFAFSEQDKFKIDQFVMNGGKVLWLLDKMSANIDSLRRQDGYVPYEFNLNLDNLLFKYGARLNNVYVRDMQCTKIPQVMGQEGGKPQIQLFDWVYHPMVDAASEHPIVKNLDRVDLQFPTTIDTIKTMANIKKTILLSSSEKSLMQRQPARLTFEILKYKLEAERFNNGRLPVAVLLEGQFESAYRGRVSPEMTAGLQRLGKPFREVAAPDAKMMIISDGDVARNNIDFRNNTFQPLGYNPFVKYQFANKTFLLNTIDYMLDAEGITAARMKDVKLRLLDKQKVETEKSKWQVINIALPLLFLLGFGLVFSFLRRKKYAD